MNYHKASDHQVNKCLTRPHPFVPRSLLPEGNQLLLSILPILRVYVNGIMQYVFLCVWLLSLNTCVRFACDAVCGGSSPVFIAMVHYVRTPWSTCGLPWWIRWQRICRRPGFNPLAFQSGWIHGEGKGNPLKYSCLENFMARGAWWATVHGHGWVTKTFTFAFHDLLTQLIVDGHWDCIQLLVIMNVLVNICWHTWAWNWGYIDLEVGFPGGSDGKASVCNAGELGLIPGSGRSPGEGNGNLFQYPCLENPMDRRA